jgi:hypothetical protein
MLQPSPSLPKVEESITHFPDTLKVLFLSPVPFLVYGHQDVPLSFLGFLGCCLPRWLFKSVPFSISNISIYNKIMMYSQGPLPSEGHVANAADFLSFITPKVILVGLGEWSKWPNSTSDSYNVPVCCWGLNPGFPLSSLPCT